MIQDCSRRLTDAVLHLIYTNVKSFRGYFSYLLRSIKLCSHLKSCYPFLIFHRSFFHVTQLQIIRYNSDCPQRILYLGNICRSWLICMKPGKKVEANQQFQRVVMRRSSYSLHNLSIILAGPLCAICFDKMYEHYASSYISLISCLLHGEKHPVGNVSAWINQRKDQTHVNGLFFDSS